jgi:glutamyl-tRNA reductase
MPLIACGINHKTAPLAIREQIALLPEHTPIALRGLLKEGAVNEAVILSTCNRTEIYSDTNTLALPRFIDWLTQHPQIGKVAGSDHWYWHQDQQAVGHIMRVASGLDSMMLGEPQILGQMKQAFLLAQETGTVGAKLRHLLQKVFSVTKQVRTETNIGVHPVSIAYAAVSLAKRIFSDLSKAQVLLVGAGQTIELLALHLSDHGVKHFIFTNRSLNKAEDLAAQFGGQAIPMTDIPFCLQKVNIVVSATSSPLPILGKGMVESALKIGKRRALLMLDMAVPRDIEPEVAQLEDIYLYNIDHLQEIVQENLKSRLDAAQQAEAVIDLHARYYMRQLEARDVDQTICAYREKLENFRDTALSKALGDLNQGETPEIVLKQMARLLTNKILHMPSVQLRQAALNNQNDLLLAARKLFDL